MPLQPLYFLNIQLYEPLEFHSIVQTHPLTELNLKQGKDPLYFEKDLGMEYVYLITDPLRFICMYFSGTEMHFIKLLARLYPNNTTWIVKCSSSQ